MPFTGIIDLDQLKILRSAVDQYCHDSAIVDDQERENVARLVRTLFDLGATRIEDLMVGLERARGIGRPKT